MHITFLTKRLASFASAAVFLTTVLNAAENPFIGRWALTIPGGGAGWLGITEDGDKLKGSILWGGGSVLPVSSVDVEGDALTVTRVNESSQKNAEGKTVIRKSTEVITAKIEDENILKLSRATVGEDGKPRGRAEFTGKRIPPVPAAPNLSKVKFGPPIKLFNGKDLTGWQTMGKDPSGWKAVWDPLESTCRHASLSIL